MFNDINKGDCYLGQFAVSHKAGDKYYYIVDGQQRLTTVFLLLKALYDYYHRCKSLPSRGLELKEIAFLIVVDQNGNFLRFEDRRINNKQAQIDKRLNYRFLDLRNEKNNLVFNFI